MIFQTVNMTNLHLIIVLVSIGIISNIVAEIKKPNLQETLEAFFNRTDGTEWTQILIKEFDNTLNQFKIQHSSKNLKNISLNNIQSELKVNQSKIHFQDILQIWFDQIDEMWSDVLIDDFDNKLENLRSEITPKPIKISFHNLRNNLTLSNQVFKFNNITIDTNSIININDLKKATFEETVKFWFDTIDEQWTKIVIDEFDFMLTLIRTKIKPPPRKISLLALRYILTLRKENGL